MENNLILRHSTPSDADQLQAFNSRIHFFVPDHATTIPAMTRDLLSGRHPAFQPEDFTLVVEKASGRIVSAMGLISQTWSYAGVPLGVGRPELVGTDPDYRGRGLIREQFRAVHQICRERDQIVQAITGIPFFYRQFGYELGLGYGGGRIGSAALPGLPAAAPAAQDYCIIPARPEDLDWIQPAYLRGCERYLLTCQRDLAQWRYELCEKSDTNIHKVEIASITAPGGEAAGFLVCPRSFGPVTEKMATWYELLPGFSWQAVTPSVLRYLAAQGQKEAALQGSACERIGLLLGDDHPAYAAAAAWLAQPAEPGAWYVRVPDLAEFLNRVRPVLNARLGASDWNHYSGRLRISMYAEAVCLEMQQGALLQASPYRPTSWEDAEAAFPYLSFLQLLFGYRSLSDLRYAYADCWCHPRLRGLLETLFPRLPSAMWGIA